MGLLAQQHDKITSPLTIWSAAETHTHMPCTEVCSLFLNPLSWGVLGRRGKKISTHLLPPCKKSLQCRVTMAGVNWQDAAMIRKDFQGHSARVLCLGKFTVSPKAQLVARASSPADTAAHPSTVPLPSQGRDGDPLFMPVSTDSAFHGGTSVSHRSPTWSSGSQYSPKLL